MHPDHDVARRAIHRRNFRLSRRPQVPILHDLVRQSGGRRSGIHGGFGEILRRGDGSSHARAPVARAHFAANERRPPQEPSPGAAGGATLTAPRDEPATCPWTAAKTRHSVSKSGSGRWSYWDEIGWVPSIESCT